VNPIAPGSIILGKVQGEGTSFMQLILHKRFVNTPGIVAQVSNTVQHEINILKLKIL
jgi:hypothetical protein